MTERVLSARELNRALLARQLLLERAPISIPRALERRSVAQGTLMRSTIHLVSARDYWPLALAVERPRRDWWLKANRDGLGARDMRARRAGCARGSPGAR